jgi:hypothetical protein
MELATARFGYGQVGSLYSQVDRGEGKVLDQLILQAEAALLNIRIYEAVFKMLGVEGAPPYTRGIHR